MRRWFFIGCLLLVAGRAFAQTDAPPAAEPQRTGGDYQIYLQKPVQEIKQLLNNKSCEPIDGEISDGKKSIIMHGYEKGSKVYLQIIYTDGTTDEFVRSPCFIDPVI